MFYHHFRPFVRSALALGLAGACVAQAHAAPAELVPAVGPGEELVLEQVHFADLDLTTTAGRATLDRRIDRAAGNVCSGLRDTSDRTFAENRFDHCYRQAKASARERMATMIANRALAHR
ncbi:MAG TPA: UrcA family protein [Novosphingobium sp.]|nr:UrcA family protein [Novosphingobium sp.]